MHITHNIGYICESPVYYADRYIYVFINMRTRTFKCNYVCHKFIKDKKRKGDA